MTRPWTIERRAQQLDNLTNAHTVPVIEAARLLWRSVPSTVDDTLRYFIKQFLQPRDPGPASRNQAATHEAGHYIAFEAQGMVACIAEIYGTAGGHHGWGGMAGALERPLFDNCMCSAEDLMDEARAAIAGPWSEHTLAEGDFYASVGEVVETHLLAARAAELLSENPQDVLFKIIEETAALVEAYQSEIRIVAARLCRQRRIARDKCLEEALCRVQTIPVDELPPANQIRTQQLWRLMTGLPGIDDLIRQIEPKGANP